MILGLLEPTSGTINLSGKPLSTFTSEEIARRIQPVFQDPIHHSIRARRSARSSPFHCRRKASAPAPSSMTA